MACVFVVIAIIMLYEAWQNAPRTKGDALTAFAALVVGIIYAIPLLFDVRVVDMRGALRAALITYGANYIISHHRSLFAFVRAITGHFKKWKLHRS
jgi:hypothetical protein